MTLNPSFQPKPLCGSAELKRWASLSAAGVNSTFESRSNSHEHYRI